MKRVPIIGATIKAYRKRLGWTVETLAEPSRVSIATIKRLESPNAKQAATHHTAVRLTIALGIEIDDLMTRAVIDRTIEVEGEFVPISYLVFRDRKYFGVNVPFDLDERRAGRIKIMTVSDQLYSELTSGGRVRFVERVTPDEASDT